MDFKDQLQEAYNADASRRIENEEKKEEWKIHERDTFGNLLLAEGKSTILELGAGVGTDSEHFQTSGFDVLAIDFSDLMVEECRRKGIDALALDLYELDKISPSFDAIYSMNVLLHIPKADLPKILDLISQKLNENGLFFYGVYGGEDIEKTIIDKSKMGLPRFFSFLSDKTLRGLVKKKFEIVSFKSVDIGSKDPNFHFQSLILRKK